VERDPYEQFLESCLKESSPPGGTNADGAREIAEDICPSCLERVVPGSRFCACCGKMQSVPEGVTGTFKPRTLIKQRLAITIVAIERNCEIAGRIYTRLHLKVRNLSSIRAHLSLTYVDSVLIDLTGRQFSPVEADELPDGNGEPVFPTWFYVYPEAFRDGVLLYRESPVPLQRAIVCAMHQENEDELFVFDLDSPPKMED
jgi:hypothetical protein